MATTRRPGQRPERPPGRGSETGKVPGQGRDQGGSGILGKVRLAAWAPAGIAAFIGGALVLGELQNATRQGANPPAAVRIGGDFTLTAHTGETFSSDRLKGKPHAVFFGFTHCPDICPTTLLEMTKRIDALGEKAKDLEVLFITVDPERDTVDLLSRYLSAFHDGITGLTGTPQQIADVMAKYRAISRKVPSENDPSDYTMDHTATVYLFDRSGKLVSTLDWQEDEAVQMKKLERLVGAAT